MKDIYVVFKNSDIKGETRDSKHAAEYGIEVGSFEHRIQQPKSAASSSSGGHTAERTEHDEMVFTKEIDSASTKLWQASSAGTVYKDVEIYFYRAFGGQDKTQSGTKRVNYLKIQLKNVVVSSVSTNIVSGTELPTEVFGLKYSAVQWTYNEAPLDGSSAKNTNVQGMWNLKTNDVSFAG
ncbi:Hcp family type VI secretion system effector [Rubrivivax gelatinosus]|uniref:Hcp1 family type VI secretion system effector n=1 Tax=Rubrivivax gelatinosus TaxID=28068 RepID=A0ABS1DXV0_RUBGE|nr:type VI secretion system tube protein Hcp [Rubrivivax gelatinosus]MBK1714333.1 Hcp1 family type VI secretion system effector [Rubrivivax gelatinosus]